MEIAYISYIALTIYGISFVARNKAEFPTIKLQVLYASIYKLSYMYFELSCATIPAFNKLSLWSVPGTGSQYFGLVVGIE